MNVRATFIELFSRVIKIDKTQNGDVYWNGDNNLYPNEVELVVNNSPTASRASKIMAKYIGGSGLVNEASDILVNEAKNYKLSNIASLAAKNMAKQGGVWYHVGFGISDDGTKVVPKVLDILDYPKCRKQKEDDDNNERKIFYRDYTIKQTFGKAKVTEKWFYPFDDNQEVIIEQIKADYKLKKGEPTDNIAEMLPHYRGQVYYYNSTPEYKYALALIDSVYSDADTEARISTYINGEVREGFLGKTLVLTQGLDEETAKQVERDVANWLGSENASGIFHMDIAQAEDLSKVIKIEQLKAQLDPDLFIELCKSLRTNILGAYNSIPEILVIPQAGVMGQSGEAYVQAKKFYNEQTSDERWALSETLTYLGFPCEIKPIDDGTITTV